MRRVVVSGRTAEAAAGADDGGGGHGHGAGGADLKQRGVAADGAGVGVGGVERAWKIAAMITDPPAALTSTVICNVVATPSRAKTGSDRPR